MIIMVNDDDDGRHHLESTTTTTTTMAPNSMLMANLNVSSITEEDELILLNFPASRHEDLSTAIPLTAIFALLLVTGCIGNLCTAIVIARPKNRYMHTATNYYLFSLAMSDFLFLILGLPQEMFTLWQRYPYAMGESFCIIRGYLSEATTYASILTISAFTIERYVAICHPLWAHTMSQLPRAITSIVIIWLLAAICAIPPAAELGIVTQKGPITHRTLEQSAQCATKRTIYENMFVVSAIVFFIVPMIIVTVLYILIAIELRRSSKMNAAITKQSSSSHGGSHNSHHNHHQPPNQIKQSASGHQMYPSCAHQHGQQHHPGLRGGHLRRASRSQQQISGAAVTAGGGLFVDVPELRTQNNCSGDPPEANRKERESLMANIMSQRPSSALGTEQCQAAAASPHPVGCELGHVEEPEIGVGGSSTNLPFQVAQNGEHRVKHRGHLSHFWPLFWTTARPKDDPVNDSTACPACRCPSHLSRTSSANYNIGQHPGNNGSHHGHPNQSINLFPGTQTTAQSPPDLLSSSGGRQRVHTPLSYHESLIHHPPAMGHSQQQQQQDESNQLAGKNQKTHLLPTHQMSLQHMPTYQASSLKNLAPSSHYHHHNHQHHHHHHNHKPHHHQGSGGNRRSAAASSKKSVIRMLVAVVVSFFICWVPFHAQRLLASYLNKDENQNQFLLDLYTKITHISGVLYYLSSTINPLLYQIMSAKFRLAFKETFKCSLFKCFRQQASTSPTNSLKENHHHHPQHHAHQHHQQASICSSQSHCCTSSGHWYPAATPRLAQSKSSQAVRLGSRDLCACQPSQASDFGCQRQSLEAPEQGQQKPQAASQMGAPVVGRLRVWMGSTLNGLFRPAGGGWNRGRGSRLAGCANCCCCGARGEGAGAGAGSSVGLPPAISGAGGGDNGNSRDLGAPSAQLIRAEVSRFNGGGDTGRPSGSCASSPLLGQPADCFGANVAQLSSSPSNFAAHTMLKFIRNISPGANGAGQQQIALSRLSSREEEEDGDESSVEQVYEHNANGSARTGRRSSGRPRSSQVFGQDNQASDSINNNNDDNNNNNNNNKKPPPPKRNNKQILIDTNEHMMISLIKATNTGEAELEETGSGLMQAQSLGLTSGESGNSSGSSPDQGQRMDSGASRRFWAAAPNKVNRSESNRSNGNKTNPPATGRRRRSLQQPNMNQQQHHHHHNHDHQLFNGGKLSVGNRQMALAGQDTCNLDQRRESSSSSTTNNNNNNKDPISSSLDSSGGRPQLGLNKLSFSTTTTSAIGDCGSSITTTNSQLTGSGSHPTLANQECDLVMSRDLSADDDEESTVINLHRFKDGGSDDDDDEDRHYGRSVKNH